MYKDFSKARSTYHDNFLFDILVEEGFQVLGAGCQNNTMCGYCQVTQVGFNAHIAERPINTTKQTRGGIAEEVVMVLIIHYFELF